MKVNWNKIRINTIYSLSLLLIGAKYIGLLTGGWFGLVLFIIGLIVLCLLIVLSLIHLIVISRDRSFTNKNSLPLLIAILFVSIVLLSPVERIIEKTKSEVLLFGFCEHTVSDATIRLREDHTYEYSTSAFLDNVVYKGIYYQNNDTIFLSLTKNRHGTFSDTLVFDRNFLIELGDSTRHRHEFKIEINKIEKMPVPNMR